MISAKEKIKNNLIGMIFKVLPQMSRGNTFAQSGEDVIIDFLLQSRGIQKPSYLDIGSNYPVWGNNTYLFYKRGAKGILVEPDDTFIPLIKKIRPNDKLLNIGVGLVNQKEADFYIFENSGLSTFSKEESEIRERMGNKIKKVTKVKLKIINDIISENFDAFPDLLSIDIEGLDLPVLKTLDLSKYPIPIICAETCTFSNDHIKPKDEAIIDFMISRGYFVYADTYINTIFVNSQWFVLKG